MTQIKTSANLLLEQPSSVATAGSTALVGGTVPGGSPRKRIVHLSLGTNIGGMEKLLVEFARFADRERFELVFISLQEKGKLSADLEELQWPVYAFDKTPGFKPGLVLKLARHLRKLRPSILHTHNTAALFYGAMAGTLARVPRIIHTRHGQRYKDSNRQTWFFRVLGKLAYRVVSVSEDGRSLSLKEGIGADRTRVIHNGVDLSRFPYEGPNAKGPAVLVARLSPEKDVGTLIQAVKHVTDTLGPQHGFMLDIAGDGRIRPQLETMSESLGLSQTIRFLGERNDIPQRLANASMFVLPSITEGISLTLLEAMARGLPVVATRVGGNPEVVVHGKTGLLVPAQSPQELAAAISRLYQDSSMGKNMGLLGRQRVEKQFSIHKMIQQYEQMYVSHKHDDVVKAF
jgi:sugar transferase (PEP-CTERM/EpsH1 system associated)